MSSKTSELDYSQFAVWLDHKADTFYDAGYYNVTPGDLWEYVTRFLWKNKQPTKYFEQVHEIMSIDANDYFTFASLDAQVYNVVSLDEMNIEELF